MLAIQFLSLIAVTDYIFFACVSDVTITFYLKNKSCDWPILDDERLLGATDSLLEVVGFTAWLLEAVVDELVLEIELEASSPGQILICLQRRLRISWSSFLHFFYWAHLLLLPFLAIKLKLLHTGFSTTVSSDTNSENKYIRNVKN